MSADAELAGQIAMAAVSGGGSPLRWAVVTNTPFFGGLNIRFASAPGEPLQPEISVPYLVSAYPSPAVDDHVLVAMVSGAPVVVGKSSLPL